MPNELQVQANPLDFSSLAGGLAECREVLFMPEQSVWAGRRASRGGKHEEPNVLDARTERLVLQMPDGFTVPSTNICSDTWQSGWCKYEERLKGHTKH